MTIHVGDKFGKLSVVSLFCRLNSRRLYAECRCECGKTTECYWQNLVHERTKSCGCWRKTAEPYLASRRRKPFGHASAVQLYNAYRYHARCRRKSFSLSMEDFRRLTSSLCAYCGSPPAQVNKLSKPSNGDYVYNGLDRVDNTVGYEKENVVSCCGCCNRAKKNMLEKDFTAWLDRVVEFRSLL